MLSVYIPIKLYRKEVHKMLPVKKASEDVIAEFNKWCAEKKECPSKSNSNGLSQSIDAWANALYNASGFSDSISYSSNWYESLSDVEILSRLIYGEATTSSNYATEQNAVTWVLINRKNSSSFPGTLREVALQSGQFYAIVGTESSTRNARNPTMGSVWKHAIWLACAILTTSNESDYMWLFGKPIGINNQVMFYASSLAKFGKADGLMTINGNRVKDVAYAGIGEVTTIDEAEKNASSSRNVYYNYYDYS